MITTNTINLITIVQPSNLNNSYFLQCSYKPEFLQYIKIIQICGNDIFIYTILIFEFQFNQNKIFLSRYCRLHKSMEACKTD